MSAPEDRGHPQPQAVKKYQVRRIKAFERARRIMRAVEVAAADQGVVIPSTYAFSGVLLKALDAESIGLVWRDGAEVHP